MRRRLITGAEMALIVAGSLALLGAQGKKTTPDPALLGISNNGQVLHSPTVIAIFWGPEWSDPNFANDIVAGLDTLLSGYSGSDYAEVATQYYDRTGWITPDVFYAGKIIDPSAPPPPGGLTGSAIIGEACKITNNQPDPDAVYVVYSSTDKGTLGGAGCGSHTWGTCGRRGPAIQAIGVPYTTGTIESGCNGVQDTETGHSLALAQMANVTIHELVETITDPRGTGWRDGNSLEIGDKCILVFPPWLTSFPVFSNGSVWKLQSMWSNEAYLSKSGVPNNAGQASLESSLVTSEWHEAFARDPTGANRTLVPVRVEPVEPPPLLRSLVFIDLVGKDVEEAKEVLLAGISTGRAKPERPVLPTVRHVAVPYQPLSYPGESAVADPAELLPYIAEFRRDHPDPRKSAFIMMRFGDSRRHHAIAAAIRQSLAVHDIAALRADDRAYAEYLMGNVRTYMHGCGFGVAVFERIESESHNPNVALEVGYMLALRKRVCLLKDITLNQLPTDMVGSLYSGFDLEDVEASIERALNGWLRQRGLAQA